MMTRKTSAEDSTLLSKKTSESFSSTPLQPAPVEDRWYLSYVLLSILGAGLLWPYNTLVTVPDYFKALYPNANLIFWVPSILQYPALILSALMVKYGDRVSFKLRILVPFALCVVSMILIPIVGLYVKEGNTNVGPLAITIVCVFFAGIANSIASSSLFGFASMFPGLYTQALMGGNGYAGLLVTVLRAIIDAFYPANDQGAKDSSFIFFFVAAAFSLVCFASFIILLKLDFTQYFLKKKESEAEATASFLDVDKSPDLDSAEVGLITRKRGSILNDQKVSPSVSSVFWKIIDPAFCVWSVFVMTFMVFPGLTSELVSHNGISSTYFTLILFIEFNAFDVIGRTLPSKVILISPGNLKYFCLARFALYPLFFFALKSNVFANDAWPFVFMAVFALTNGYFASLAMMFGPTKVSEAEREHSGFLMLFFLSFGIFTGSHIALGLRYAGV